MKMSSASSLRRNFSTIDYSSPENPVAGTALPRVWKQYDLKMYLNQPSYDVRSENVSGKLWSDSTCLPLPAQHLVNRVTRFRRTVLLFHFSSDLFCLFEVSTIIK